MSQFEDFIRDELPLRQVVIKAAGDPTTGSGVIAAIGTYYLNTDDGFRRYEKYGSGNTDWREVVTSSGDGVQTDAVIFSDNSKITTIQVASLSGAQTFDTFDTTNHVSSKYIINGVTSTDVFCTEALVTARGSDIHMTQYGTLGNTSMVSLNATLSGSQVNIIATTTESVDLSIYKFMLS
jgi:hypothetical protein